MVFALLAMAAEPAAAPGVSQKPQQEFVLKEHFGVRHAEQVVVFEFILSSGNGGQWLPSIGGRCHGCCSRH